DTGGCRHRGAQLLPLSGGGLDGAAGADADVVAGVGDMSGTGARRTAFTVLAIVFALGALGGQFGFALFTGWFSGEDGGIHRVHYLGFGILFGVLLTSAVVALALKRPEDRPSGFLQVVAVAVAAMLGAAVSTDG